LLKMRTRFSPPNFSTWYEPGSTPMCQKRPFVAPAW